MLGEQPPTSIPNMPQPVEETIQNEILTMVIELDGGEEKLLRLYEGQNPQQVASQFCKTNGIDTKYIATIEQNMSLILNNLNQSKTKAAPINFQINNDQNHPEDAKSPEAANYDTKIEQEHPFTPINESAIPKMPESNGEDDIAEEYRNVLNLKDEPIKSAHKFYLGKSSIYTNNTSMVDKDSLAINSSKSKSAEKGSRIMMLYQNGLKSKEQIKQVSVQESMRRSIKELEGVTWTPNISMSMKVLI